MARGRRLLELDGLHKSFGANRVLDVAAKEYADAGFTQLALVQIGGDQQRPFLEWSEQTLLPA